MLLENSGFGFVHFSVPVINATTTFPDYAFYWRMKSRPEIHKRGETVKFQVKNLD